MSATNYNIRHIEGTDITPGHLVMTFEQPITIYVQEVITELISALAEGCDFHTTLNEILRHGVKGYREAR